MVGMSLMNMLYSVAPSIDPCGTPALMRCVDDD